MLKFFGIWVIIVLICLENNSGKTLLKSYTNILRKFSITSDSDTICSGNTVTFRASANEEVLSLHSFHYQWKVNGLDLGEDTSVFIYTPRRGDLVSCDLKTDTPGIQEKTVSSNVVEIMVNPFLPVSVSIVPSENPFCEGSFVTFNAYPMNGGLNPLYEWKVNGLITGKTGPVFCYIPVKGDQVTCTLQSDIPFPLINKVSSEPIFMIENESSKDR